MILKIFLCHFKTQEMTSYEITSPLLVLGDGITPGQINYSNGLNSVQVRAPTGLTGNVNFILPGSNGINGQTLKLNSLGNTEWGNSSSNPSSSIPLSFRFNSPNGDPAGTNSTTYVVLGSIVYRGTTLDNSITNIFAVVQTTSGSSGQIEVSDFTNGTIIATSAIFSSATKIAINLGIISNLPPTQAILEIAMKKIGGGGGQPQIHSIQIYG